MKLFFYLGIVLVVGKGYALPSGIQDDAKYFSPAAQKNLKVSIRAVSEMYGKNIFLKTVPGIPDLGKQEANDNRPIEKKLVDYIAKQYTIGPNDIILYFTKNPGLMFVNMGSSLVEKREFTNEDQGKLMRILMINFRNGQFDKGALEGFAFIRNTLSNTIDGTQIPDTFYPVPQNAEKKDSKTSLSEIMKWAGLGLVAVLAIWLLSGFLSSLGKAPTAVPPVTPNET